MITPYKTSVALLFSVIFHLIAVVFTGLSVQQFIGGLDKPDWDLVTLIIKPINTLVIALAMYELGIGVMQGIHRQRGRQNIFQNIRRSIARFVGTDCIALVLEALIMIIKYSQLDLACNLYYPVAILAACSLLLTKPIQHNSYSLHQKPNLSKQIGYN